MTPSFNQAEYLEETISSVLTQEYDGLEYVIVDGGSTDGSVEAIRHHAARLAWYVSEDDRGYADAVNKGFAHTSGEIMGWIGSSDLYLPWTFRVVAEVFSAHPGVDWITGAPCVAGSDGLIRATGASRVNRYDFLSGGASIQQESTFWRRRLWDAAGGLDSTLRYAADFDLWTRFFANAELYSVSCPLAAFRVHGQRLGRSDPEAYPIESRRSLAKMRDSASPRDMRRARSVAVARKVAGRVGSQILEVSPGVGWYQHPMISYDFDQNTWKVHVQRRLGQPTTTG